MALQVGRLTDVGFALRGTAPTGPVTTGAFNAPTQWFRFLPPWNWNPKINLLESAAISKQRELPVKAVKGAAELKDLKATAELEPSSVFGTLLLAALGQQTLSGNGTSSAHAHNFESLDASQLPTIDWWEDEGDKQFGYAGMMCSKMDLTATKDAPIKFETDWTGISYVDALNLSPARNYSPLRPLTFADIDAKLGGLLLTNLDEVALTLDNGVETEHALRSDSNFPSRVFSKHQLVTGKASQIFEDASEYNKFLSVSSPSLPNQSSAELIVTSGETFVEGSLTGSYVLRFLLPKILYRTAEVQLMDGVVKVGYTWVALPASGTIGAGGNAYAFANRSIVAQFVNGAPGLNVTNVSVPAGGVGTPAMVRV